MINNYRVLDNTCNYYEKELKVAERLSSQNLLRTATAVLATGAFALGGAESESQAEIRPLSSENSSQPESQKLVIGRAAVDRYTDFRSVPAGCAVPDPNPRVATACPVSIDQCAKELNKLVMSQPTSLTITPQAKDVDGRTVSAKFDFELAVYVPPFTLNIFTDPNTAQAWQRECNGIMHWDSYLRIKTKDRPMRRLYRSAAPDFIKTWGDVMLTTNDTVSYKRECETGKRVTLQYYRESAYWEGNDRRRVKQATPVWHLPCRTGKEGKPPKNPGNSK